MKQNFIDHNVAKECMIQEDKWASSHGIIRDNGYLGTSLLYYSFVYSLPAKTAVILGSGDGLVPRFVRQAQREVPDPTFAKESLCILIDADKDIHSFGAPSYHDKNSHFFKEAYPEIEIWKMTTDQAITPLKEKGVKIDFLHIDADHTFSQSLLDFENYLPLMSDDFIITMHDTAINHLEGWKDGCVARTIALLRKEMESGGRFSHLEMININTRRYRDTHYFGKKMECCGVAVIKPKVDSQWDVAYREAPWLTGNI